MSRQHLGLTTQFPSQGMGWPRRKVHSLAKWIVVSGNRIAIACVTIEVHDHYTTAPLSTYRLVPMVKKLSRGFLQEIWHRPFFSTKENKMIHEQILFPMIATIGQCVSKNTRLYNIAQWISFDIFSFENPWLILYTSPS